MELEELQAKINNLASTLVGEPPKTRSRSRDRERMALAPFPGAMKVVKSFCENVKTDGIGIGIAPENGTETGIGTGAMGGDVTVPAVSPETATAIRGAGKP
ncbi:hypothetical protein AK812_SmicGene9495 [Symbiodinium microadriaticum]|uniref:Uncharacterized protein n=1 Tax=Symbiodinium microadriaticum TaxID=2951 RepID=A0A1Q9EI98_SYMMI|nr:hypothetical protein AK812_SmicGene9495 [Symbiodinium microadriaticum]